MKFSPTNISTVLRLRSLKSIMLLPDPLLATRLKQLIEAELLELQRLFDCRLHNNFIHTSGVRVKVCALFDVSEIYLAIDSLSSLVTCLVVSAILDFCE